MCTHQRVSYLLHVHHRLARWPPYRHVPDIKSFSHISCNRKLPQTAGNREISAPMTEIPIVTVIIYVYCWHNFLLAFPATFTLVSHSIRNLHEQSHSTIISSLPPVYSAGLCINVVVTCEIKLLQNYFRLCRRPSEIILPEIISKLFRKLIAAREYFTTCSMSLKCFWNNFSGWDNFISVSDVVTCEIKRRNSCKNISKLFYFTCNHA